MWAGDIGPPLIGGGRNAIRVAYLRLKEYLLPPPRNLDPAHPAATNAASHRAENSDRGQHESG